MKNLIFILLLTATLILPAQTFNISVEADTHIGEIYPLWNDYWELNLQFGYGPNTCFFPNTPHIPFMADTGFVDAMNLLKPRSIKISIGTFVYLPEISYASLDTNVLKTLPTEFYRGGNSLAEADDPDNYYFEYLDSQLEVLDSLGIEPFLNLDYMPFTLSSNQTPAYSILSLCPPSPFFQLDNLIRTVPPKNNQVYARVLRNVIRHTKGLFKGNKDYGITYYEIWNEPDHATIAGLPTFWRGTEYELYDMYEAITTEIQNDLEISNEIKIGCCSFGILNDDEIQFAKNFLIEINNNNTRLDFLSVHPYSDDLYTSLDVAKLDTAISGIETYAPDAELINAEWGELDNSASAYINTLESDLINFKDITFMLDREVKFAHFVSLVEYSTGANPILGVFSNDPIQPKITAVARANMNKLIETPHRLKTEGLYSEFVLAGKNEDETKVVIAVSAPKPDNGGTHTINLDIENLPFNYSYDVTVFELSESDYDNGDYFKIKDQFTDNRKNLTLTFNYYADQNSGRLYTLVLEDNEITAIDELEQKAGFYLYPNPSSHTISLISKKSELSSIKSINIYSSDGVLLQNIHFQQSEGIEIDISSLPKGVFLAKINTKDGSSVLKFIKD